jgi:hypothetical protein
MGARRSIAGRFSGMVLCHLLDYKIFHRILVATTEKNGVSVAGLRARYLARIKPDREKVRHNHDIANLK